MHANIIFADTDDDEPFLVFKLKLVCARASGGLAYDESITFPRESRIKICWGEREREIYILKDSVCSCDVTIRFARG